MASPTTDVASALLARLAQSNMVELVTTLGHPGGAPGWKLTLTERSTWQTRSWSSGESDSMLLVLDAAARGELPGVVPTETKLATALRAAMLEVERHSQAIHGTPGARILPWYDRWEVTSAIDRAVSRGWAWRTSFTQAGLTGLGVEVLNNLPLSIEEVQALARKENVSATRFWLAAGIDPQPLPRHAVLKVLDGVPSDFPTCCVLGCAGAVYKEGPTCLDHLTDVEGA